MKIQVVFYSLYGHVYQLAEAIAAGAKEVDGADVSIFQAAEMLDDEVLGKMGAVDAKKAFAHIPIADPKHLADADAIIFGSPTRFGVMTFQMKAFLDQTGSLWMSGKLVGKVGSVFSSSGTQHGGQESTILSFHSVLLSHGMIIVGLPYTNKGLMIGDEVSGGTPFGVTTIAGPDGSRMPSENELELARGQGRHVAEITAALVKGRG